MVISYETNFANSFQNMLEKINYKLGFPLSSKQIATLITKEFFRNVNSQEVDQLKYGRKPHSLDMTLMLVSIFYSLGAIETVDDALEFIELAGFNFPKSIDQQHIVLAIFKMASQQTPIFCSNPR